MPGFCCGSFLPAASLSRLFLMFPDPWPKARHAKRRFVHPDNARHSSPAPMRPGGEWRVATDDPTYQAWTADGPRRTRPCSPPLGPGHGAPAEGWPPTRYEQKAIRAGRRPLYWSADSDRPASGRSGHRFGNPQRL